MAKKKLIVNCTTGEKELVDLTQEELDTCDAMRAISDANAQAQADFLSTRSTKLEAIKTRFQNPDPLTDAEIRTGFKFLFQYIQSINVEL